MEQQLIDQDISFHLLYIFSRVYVITEKNLQDYDREDLEAYKELMEQTNALYRDFNPENPNPRSNKSKKWEKNLKPIWQDIIDDQDNDSDEEEESGRGLAMKKFVKDTFQDEKMYLRKNGSCYRVKTVQSSDGLFLSPQHSSSASLPGIIGDGLFIKQKSGKIFNGEGLVFSNKKKSSPFKHFSILELLL